MAKKSLSSKARNTRRKKTKAAQKASIHQSASDPTTGKLVDPVRSIDDNPEVASIPTSHESANPVDLKPQPSSTSTPQESANLVQEAMPILQTADPPSFVMSAPIDLSGQYIPALEDKDFQEWLEKIKEKGRRLRPPERRTAVDPRLKASNSQPRQKIGSGDQGPHTAAEVLRMITHAIPIAIDEPSEEADDEWPFSHVYDGLMAFDERADEVEIPTTTPAPAQESSSFEQRIRDYVTNPTRPHKEETVRDATGFLNTGHTFTAYYLDHEGNPILPKLYGDNMITQKFGINIEDHMSHFRLHASIKALTDEQILLRDNGALGEENIWDTPQATNPDQEEDTAWTTALAEADAAQAGWEAAEAPVEPEATQSDCLPQSDTTWQQAPAQSDTTWQQAPAQLGTDATPPVVALTTMQQDDEVGVAEQSQGQQRAPREPQEPRPYEDLDFFQGDAEDMTDFALRTVACLINYKALEKCAHFHYADMNDLEPEAEIYFNNLPEKTQIAIRNLSAYEQFPIVVTLKFKCEDTTSKLVNTGTPAWAQLLADTFKAGFCSLILAGDDSVSLRFELLHSQLKQQQLRGDPLNQFHLGKECDQYTMKRLNIYPKDVFDKVYRYSPRAHFFSLREYLTVNAIHIAADMKGRQNQCIQFCNVFHRLRLVEIPQARGEYFGFIPVPVDKSFRLSKGDKLNITFQGQSAQNDQTWTAKVASDEVTIGPLEFYELIVRKPWYRARQTYDATSIHVLSLQGRATSEAPSRIHQDRGNLVKISMDLSNRVPKNILRAVEDMNFAAEDKPRQEWNNTIEKALLCNDHSNLPIKDMYASVRNEFPDVTAVMNLNKQQKEAILQAGKAPAGITCIQGPPGTGKTKVLRESVKPFLRSYKVRPVLMISASNAAADNLLEGMSEDLRKLKKEELVRDDRYILRPYSEESEKAIIMLIAQRTRVRNMPARHNTFLQGRNIAAEPEIGQKLLRQYAKEVDTKFEGIFDPRVTDMEHSIGKVMLEITGAVKGPLSHPIDLRFATFRRCYVAKARGDTCDKKVWDMAFLDAWDYTLKHASAIIGTTSNCGLAHILDHIKDHVPAILVDEAAHQREDELIPYFAARLKAIDGMLLVGDYLQLPPLVLLDIPEDIFAKQQTLSFMSRLVSTGFPAVVQLTVQHRSVPPLADLFNNLVYNGRLTTDDSAKVENREKAITFQKQVARFLRKLSSMLVIDVPCGDANQTHITSANSRWNNLFVIIAITMIEQALKWHPKATVAYLSLYSRQLLCVKSAISNMIDAKVPGMDRVTLSTIDGAQGREWDYVIFDLLIYDKKLGFLADFRRINVALSRARCGLIVVADIEAMRKCRGASRGFLSRLINATSSVKFAWPKTTELPTCAYYKPE